MILAKPPHSALRVFYGGYGCLEKNGGKENDNLLRQMRRQIEDVLGRTTVTLPDSCLFFFSPIFGRNSDAAYLWHQRL